MGMMGKLKEAREKVAATKKRLDSITLKEAGPEDLVEVTLTANREIREVRIDDRLLKDREQLEDYLVITLNKALKKAGEIHDAELAAAAREGMPDLPGLDALL